jgi:hypothetical protein
MNLLLLLEFQQTLIENLVKVQTDLAELLRRTASSSREAVQLEGIPEIPIVSTEGLNQLNNWLEEANIFQNLVNIFI